MIKERILYEDEDIIVCHKASGIATQTARVGQADMVSELRNYLMHTRSSQNITDGRQAKVGTRQGNETGCGRQNGENRNTPYVGVVHRLDQPVEGVLVFAKNKQAAAGLSRQISENVMEKYYYAVVCGQGFIKSGKLTDYLLKDARTNTSRITPSEVKGTKTAVLDYEILDETFVTQEEYAELEREQEIHQEAVIRQLQIGLARIRLHTGRHHQIRVQMSHAGMSLLGDYKYADADAVKISEKMHVKNVALCAYHLSFRHPRTEKKMQFEIKPEGKIFQKYVVQQIV